MLVGIKVAVMYSSHPYCLSKHFTHWSAFVGENSRSQTLLTLGTLLALDFGLPSRISVAGCSALLQHELIMNRIIDAVSFFKVYKVIYIYSSYMRNGNL